MHIGAQAETETQKARVFLVDDHPVVRQGLSLLIDREPDLVVCGAADGAGPALSAMENTQIDLLVLDISLEGPDGLDLLKTIRSKHSAPACLDSLHAR